MTTANKSKLIMLGMGIALSLCSCDPARVYEQYKNIPTEGWGKDSIAAFNVQVEDTLSYNNIYINLRNTSAYPFSNIYLFVKATAPGGAFALDTVEYMLADQYGHWQGKGFSKILDNRLIFRKSVRFPRSGIYKFEIQQGMRMNVLPHVSNVGLRIEKAE